MTDEETTVTNETPETEAEQVDVMARFQAAGADATEQSKLQRHHNSLSAEDRQLDAEGIAAMTDEELADQIPHRLAAFDAITANAEEDAEEAPTSDESAPEGEDAGQEPVTAEEAQAGPWSAGDPLLVDNVEYQTWHLVGGWEAALIGDVETGAHVVGQGIDALVSAIREAASHIAAEPEAPAEVPAEPVTEEPAAPAE